MKFKVILLFLLFVSSFVSAQYRQVDWKTNVDSVVVVDTDTFWVKVDPIDFNDPGAINRTIGNYFIDFVGNRYSIEDSTSTAIKVASELPGSGVGPQSGQIGRVYRSVGSGDAPFIGGVDMGPLDESARWKKIAADNELFWRSMVTIPLDSLPFNPTNGIKHVEGTQFYDSAKHAMSYYNEIADVTINMGQENVVRAYNNTGSTITNLTPVYLDADSFKVGSNLTLIESRFIGVATHDIPDGTWGYATNLGEVGGNLSGFPDGSLLYLGDGVLTNIPPSGGEFNCFIGKKKNDSILYVSPSISDYTAEMLKPTGWPDADDNSFPDNVGIVLDAATRKVTLVATPASTYYHYQNGIKYISALDTFIWSAVEGIHLIYFDNGSMTEVVNPTDAESTSILGSYPGVMNIYWSVPQDTFIYVNNEFHTFDMNGQTKAAFHDMHGCTIIDAIPLVDFDIDGSGSLDSHAQFGNNSGSIRNEDIKTIVPATASTFGYTAFYRVGTSAWQNTFNPGFGCINTGTGRIAFNENVGGSYQLTEATSNNYVPYYLLVSNTLGRKYGMVPGDGQYSNTADAVDGALDGIPAFFTNLPIKEIAGVAIVVFQTRDAYTNSVKGRIVSVVDPITGNTVDYIDLDVTGIGGGGGSTGMTTILDDPNGPSSYAGSGGKAFRVNDSETGWIFDSELRDDQFAIRNGSDLTKKIKFDASLITTATDRTLTAPDVSDTIAVRGDNLSTFVNDLDRLGGLSPTIDNRLIKTLGTDGTVEETGIDVDDSDNIIIPGSITGNSLNINSNATISSAGIIDGSELIARGTLSRIRLSSDGANGVLMQTYDATTNPVKLRITSGTGTNIPTFQVDADTTDVNGVLDVSGDLSANTLTSIVAIGTSPLVVTSTTLVSNLNTDFLDGQHGSYYLDYNNFTNTPDLSAYVPYTGATTNVDLGLFDLYADSLSVANNAAIGGDLAVTGSITGNSLDINSLASISSAGIGTFVQSTLDADVSNLGDLRGGTQNIDGLTLSAQNLTSGYVPRFTTTLVDSPIYTDGTDVSVGGTDLSYQFQVENITSNSILQLRSSNSTVGGVYFGDTDLNARGRLMYDHSIDAMRFYESSAERMRIIGGRLLIGTTTDNTVDRLQVNGSALVQDEAYGSGWNGDLTVPTKNAIYDQLVSNHDTLFTTIVLSDETTDLTTGTDIRTISMPIDATLTGVFISVNTAPTGSTIIVDINESGTSVLSTKLSIDAGEKNSSTAATPPVISDSSLGKYNEISFDIDQIGSTVAGDGLKAIIYYIKN
jgi:hypothetical protein